MPIPGYLTGGEAENITFGSPAIVGRSRAEVQQEELGMPSIGDLFKAGYEKTEERLADPKDMIHYSASLPPAPPAYQNAIKETAELFAGSDPNLRDYMANIHWYSENIANGHQLSKEQVMEDLLKEIDSQRAGMPPKKGFMSRFKDIIGKENGGIIGLEDAGIVPELFEGQEIVKIIPDLNQMALDGNAGIASAQPVSSKLPERNVPSAPNEEGIIQLALDTEEIEDDEPIIALAEQEAKSRLDEEFTIIRSTAEADAATGNKPAFVIKSGMEDLARAAQRIEAETVEKYPEVPFDANLISSDDLVPYREELVAVFEVPELGQEEFLMAESGGLIPGYREGDLVEEEVPPGWGWIDADIIKEARSLEEAEMIMRKRYGPVIAEMRKVYQEQRGRKAEQEKRKRRLTGMSAEEVLEDIRKEKEDPRLSDVLDRMKEKGFMRATDVPLPPVGAGTFGVADISSALSGFSIDALRENIDLVKDYEASKGPMPVSDDTEKIDAAAGGIDAAAGGIDAAVGGVDAAAGGIDTALAFAGGASTAPDTDATTGQPSSSVELLKQLMGMRPDISQIQTDIETRKTGLQETLTGEGSGISKLEARLEKLVTDPDTGHEKKASDLDEEMNKIFGDMAERIPRQARYASMTAPAYASGSGAQGFIRRMKGKEMEENLFQKLNGIKLNYKSIRKAEIEARRNNDFSKLMDLSMKKQELLADLENTALDADNKIKIAQIDQAFAMELEAFKGILDVELGTGASDQKGRAQRELKRINTELATLDPDKDAAAIKILEQDKKYNEQIIMTSASDASLVASILSRNEPDVATEMIVFKFGPEVAAKEIAALGGKKTFAGLFEGRAVGFAEFYNAMKSRPQKKRSPKEEDKLYTFKKLLDLWAKGKEA